MDSASDIDRRWAKYTPHKWIEEALASAEHRITIKNNAEPDAPLAVLRKYFTKIDAKGPAME